MRILMSAYGFSVSNYNLTKDTVVTITSAWPPNSIHIDVHIRDHDFTHVDSKNMILAMYVCICMLLWRFTSSFSSARTVTSQTKLVLRLICIDHDPDHVDACNEAATAWILLNTKLHDVSLLFIYDLMEYLKLKEVVDLYEEVLVLRHSSTSHRLVVHCHHHIPLLDLGQEVALLLDHEHTSDQIDSQVLAKPMCMEAILYKSIHMSMLKDAFMSPQKLKLESTHRVQSWRVLGVREPVLVLGQDHQHRMMAMYSSLSVNVIATSPPCFQGQAQVRGHGNAWADVDVRDGDEVKVQLPLQLTLILLIGLDLERLMTMYKDLHDLAIANTLAVWVVCPHKDMEMRVEKFLFPEKDYEKTLQVFNHKIMVQPKRLFMDSTQAWVRAEKVYMHWTVSLFRTLVLNNITFPYINAVYEPLRIHHCKARTYATTDRNWPNYMFTTVPKSILRSNYTVMPNVRELDMLRRENMHITNPMIEDIFEDGLIRINSITEASAVFVLTMRMNVLLLPSPEDYKPLYKYIDVPLL
ncbi:hypothetical protein CDV55_101841 [Aspergillus turcosus]|nr:hypothetical protein CDV55_101841 [Aspergillus turcosus]